MSIKNDLLGGLYHTKSFGPIRNIVGRVDLNLVQAAVDEIGSPDSWPSESRDSHRNLSEGKTLVFRDEKHNDTPLRGAYQNVEKLVEKVLSLDNGLGTIPGKIIAAYLPPGKMIKRHRDVGEYYKFHNRIHIPLVTNTDVEMVVHGEKYFMEKGSVYLFQNLLPHSVLNKSTDQGRLHLIIDVLDPRYSQFIYRKMWLFLMLNVTWCASAYRFASFCVHEKRHNNNAFLFD